MTEYVVVKVCLVGFVMGKKKEVLFYNGRYVGKRLDEDICNKLESLRRIEEAGGYVKELRNIIYELSPSDIDVIKATKSNTKVELKKGTLERIQTVGVAYMYYARRLVLGDSVGIGKTVEVCGLCNFLESLAEKNGLDFHFLFLTEKNLVKQVTDEMIKFTGNYVQSVYGVKKSVTDFIEGNKDEIQYSVVGSHSLLNSTDFQEFLFSYDHDNGQCPFDLLVVDEAGDVLTNSATQTYKNAIEISKLFDRIILLNATPFEKDLRMFYNQINFVDETLLPTKTEFSKSYEVMSYTGPYPKFSGKYKNQDQFKYLVGYRYLARTRKNTGATMTNCSADAIVVELSPEQKELLQKTSMPTMVYDCPSYFNMGVETNIHTTPKLKALIDLLTGKLKSEKSILVYSRYKESQRSIQTVLAQHGIDASIMNGDSTQEERNNIIDHFKLGDIRVLITNVQKGLNFGNCNVCVFYTYDPNPNKMVQFEGRMTRSYNIDNKHVYLIISRGKELKTFKETISDRAKASDVFAGSDFSCVLSILLDKSRINDLS